MNYKIKKISSLDTLRETHSSLLKKYREDKNSSSLLKEIENFIVSGQALGKILENEEDRWDAQSRLDYWVAILYRFGKEPPDSTLAEFDPLTKVPQAIENIVAKKFTESDLLLLRQSLSSNNSQKRIQLGKYNINIGEGKEIQIGDRIYQDTDAEAIKKVINQVLDARRISALLTHVEFSDRAENAIPTTHQGTFVGRKAILNQLQEQLNENTRIIILHGAGGIGKTRLLLTLPDLLPEETLLWYVRNEAESIEPELASLERNKQHIIVVDDAHRYDLLPKLREILINPELGGKVKLIFATRTVFKDSILYQLGTLPNEQVGEIEIKPLENQDIDEFLQQTPYEISNQDIRHTLVRITEGNSLIASIAGRLVKKDESLVNLSRDQVLTRYLDEIIKDLVNTDFYSDKVRKYLQILAALGTVNLSEQPLRDKINEMLDISDIDEERVINCLVNSGLVERYWKTLKIASEVLADHILIQDFFNPKTKQADYQRLIFEPFFNLTPKAIFKSLAEAEVKGESLEAGSLLSQKLNEFYRALQENGNLFRYNLLNCLQDVAYLRPDDILAIIIFIIDHRESKPETIPDQFFGLYQITEEMVLTTIVELLEKTIYKGGLKDSIIYLHKIATYQLASEKYGEVRKKASEALKRIAEFQLRKPYEVQLILLDTISDWLKQDFTTNIPLSLLLITEMLRMEFHGSRTDPIKPFQIIIHKGDLEINDYLRQIRDKALELLYTAYEQANNVTTRLQIIQSLDGAIPYLENREKASKATLKYLKSNRDKTANFFAEKVIPNAELPILAKVKKWWRRAQNCSRYQSRELKILQQKLQSHRGYQLYRLLVGGYLWDEDDNQMDWQTAEEKQGQKINQYINSISSLEETIQELEVIVQQSRQAGNNYASGLNKLLKILGEKQPKFAHELIEQVLTKNLELKNHLGFVLAGIRCSNLEQARAYVRAWIEKDDRLLWIAIAKSYQFINWNQSGLQEEYEILRQLVNKESSAVDLQIFNYIPLIAINNSSFSVELLKILASCEDENVLLKVAETVSLGIFTMGEKTWEIEFDNFEDFITITDNFVRLSRLDYSAEKCLVLLGNKHPMKVIDLIKLRMKHERQHSYKEYYKAFPKPSRIFENWKYKPEYVDILRHIRNWILEDDFVFTEKIFRLLKELSPKLKSYLDVNFKKLIFRSRWQNVSLKLWYVFILNQYRVEFLDCQLYKVLMEWIESGDKEKLKAIARMLRHFNAGQDFYDLSREIVLRTQDEEILSSIHSAISLTPGVITGNMSNFTKQRIKEVSPWLNDENFQVRRFAKQIDESLKQDLEREEAQEKLRERNW